MSVSRELLCSRSTQMPWLGTTDVLLSVVYTALLLGLLALTLTALLHRPKS